MREILTQLDAWRARDEPVALATLVAVRGSSPRRPGATMAVTTGGAMIGSVSGGCVETAVIESARRVLAGGPAALESYGLADEHDLSIGLPCGSVDVLVERLPDGAAWDALVEARRARADAACAVVLEPERLRGHRLLVRRGGAGGRRLGGDGEPDGDSLVVGSIGAALDAGVLEAARAFVGRDAAEVVVVESGDERVSVFIEGVACPEGVFIVGATEIAVHLSRLALGAGFHVTVIDPRSAFADPARFDADVELVREWPEAALADDDALAAGCLVALSHDMKFDVPALTRALAAGAAYVGALGSKRTHAKRCDVMREAGVAAADLARIHSPVGLDIGASGPYEIAVAVLAELIATRPARRRGAS